MEYFVMLQLPYLLLSNRASRSRMELFNRVTQIRYRQMEHLALKVSTGRLFASAGFNSFLACLVNHGNINRCMFRPSTGAVVKETTLLTETFFFDNSNPAFFSLFRGLCGPYFSTTPPTYTLSLLTRPTREAAAH